MMTTLKYEKLVDQSRGRFRRTEQKFELRCVLCGEAYPRGPLNRCPVPGCGGVIDAFYDLNRVRIRPAGAMRRYGDLLPVENPDDLFDFGEGDTPCLHARHLGRHLGLEALYLKDETRNPTCSTKDRIASVGLSMFRELGVRNLVLASTGNSSTSYGRGVQMTAGFRAHIFVGRAFVGRLNYKDHPAVTTWVLDEDFASAGRKAQDFARFAGFHPEGGFFSLARREGLKTAYLEAVDQMPVEPLFVFQAVSSGMGLLGAYKGFLEYRALGRLTRLPRLVAVQQESCAPMAQAFREDSEVILDRHIVPDPTGLAAAILRGDPSQSYPYVRSITSGTGGGILSVSEDEMRRARRALLEIEGIDACYASAAALAGMIRLARSGVLRRTDPVLVNITGADRVGYPTPANLLPFTDPTSALALLADSVPHEPTGVDCSIGNPGTMRTSYNTGMLEAVTEAH